MKFEDLEKMVIEWAEDRGIFEQANTAAQFVKLGEEYEELHMALTFNNKKEIIDSIGDMLVVMTILTHMFEVDLFKCYATAYLEIKDRKGKMVDGLFVKEK